MSNVHRAVETAPDTGTRSWRLDERSPAVLYVPALGFALGFLVAGRYAGALLVVMSTLLVGVAATLVSQRRLDLFEPLCLFFAFFALLFIGRPAWDISHGRLVYDNVDLSSTYTRLLVVALLALAGFLGGYLSPYGPRIAQRLPGPSTTISDRRLLFFCGAVFVLGALGTVALAIRSGGFAHPSSFFLGRSQSRLRATVETDKYLVDSVALMVAGSMIIFARALEREQRRLLALAFGSAAVVLAVTLPAGNRKWPVALVLGYATLYYLVRGRRPRVLVLLVGLLCALSVVTVARELRYSHSQAAISRAEHALIPWNGVEELFSGGDTGPAPALAAEMTVVPSRLGYSWGASTLGFPVGFVPRALWHGKPLPPSQQVLDALFQPPACAPKKPCPTFSTFGDPYHDGGYIGVLLFAVLFGVGWQVVWSYYQRNRSDILVTAGYSVVLPMLALFLRGDFFLKAMETTAMMAVFIVASFVCRRRKHAA